MMKIKLLLTVSIALLLYSNKVQSQSNNLSSSPYSLYGLGLVNEVNTGKTNALGKAGIAMPSNTSINNLNPASFGSIPLKSFLFDIGIKAEQETLFDNGEEESRFNANFSNMAIAFPLTKKSGVGLTLIPFTNVGYVVLGVESEIEGSPEIFKSNINGSGGLSDLKLNYGYALSENLRLGLSGSFLFGKISEEEVDFIGESILTISEDNYYNGFRVGLGFQYDLNDRISLGGIMNSPTNLNGSQTRLVVANGYDPYEEDDDLDAFKLPLELGVGVHAKLNDRLFFNLDYKRSFWDATNQSDLVGDYVDQDFIGFGGEFIPKNQRMNYRFGFNVDNGNLAINEERVSNYALNAGIGFPISGRTNSMLNLGYSYGQKGTVSNGLIKENYHRLTLNFSLEDLWFIKKKYD